MAKPERRKLERVQYWQGQMLRAQDFLNLQGVEAQRRWWHNRSIHNAYGVAEGLEATLTGSFVTVSPGVAYDIFGRELILERAQTVPLPAASIALDGPPKTLLVRYLAPGHDLPPDEIMEVCWTQRGPIRPGTLVFAWKATKWVTPADGVAIMALIYAGGGTTESGVTSPLIPMQDPSFSPIFAEPISRPVLASGATVPGQTSWEPWTAGYTTITTAGAVLEYSALAGVQTWVDTSAAGFTDIPCYFAWLQGPLWSSQPQLFLPAMLTNVADASMIGFTFQLVLPGTGNPIPIITIDIAKPEDAISILASDFVVGPNDFDPFAQQQGLYVSWIGCQTQGKACSCSQQSPAATQSTTSGPN